MRLSFNIFLIFNAIILMGCSNAKLYTNDLIEIEYPAELNIVKRADWGWVPIESIIKTHEIKYITTHHGGIEFLKDEDPVTSVRNLQSWSREEKQWVDIPYHFMIDLEGAIYEARPLNIPGDTNTEYDPTNHALIELMGNYEIQELNEKQLTSLIDLIKFLKNKYNVPVDKIKTHKDYAIQTVCPGKNIYKYFENGYIIKEVSSE